MKDLVLEFNMEEVLVIDDFVDPTQTGPVMPVAAIPVETSMAQSLQEARDAILSGRRLVI